MKRIISTAFLAIVLTSAGVVVDQALPLGWVSSAQAQDKGAAKKERETRRTPALRNKVYEKLAEAQAFAEAKDRSERAHV